jgi:nitrous oxide reductase accessory protein NosL
VRVFAIFALGALLLAACGAPKTGPEDIHFDRDICALCRMIISDPFYAAEVRAGDGKIYKFDDVGGAVKWLVLNDPEGQVQEIWVRDMRTGTKWLDARAAFYLPEQTTPMDFGFGAIAARETGAVSYSEMAEKALQKRGSMMNMEMGN